jgi:3-methyladenine DNA glycosylase AlkD
VRPLVEKRLAEMKELQGFIEESSNLSVVDQLVEEIVDAYKANPDVTRLPQT